MSHIHILVHPFFTIFQLRKFYLFMNCLILKILVSRKFVDNNSALFCLKMKISMSRCKFPGRILLKSSFGQYSICYFLYLPRVMSWNSTSKTQIPKPKLAYSSGLSNNANVYSLFVLGPVCRLEPKRPH